MVIFPNAKINLGLNVIEKRSDGFHNIETLFYPVPLTDMLEVIPGSLGKENEPVLNLSGIEIPGGQQQNLCVKAYNLLKREFNLPGIHVFLHKIIPMGAGLGGGSSDGAFMLLLLNDLFKLSLSTEQLVHYASQLGSDCAFFIQNKPTFGKGKGNELEEISLNLSGYTLVLVHPGVHVSTAEAYAGVTPGKPEISVKEIALKPVKSWNGLLVNDFEASVFAKHPEIKLIKDKLYKLGATYASMTGSGSAVFGIFDKPVSLKEEFTGMFCWEGKL